MPALVLPVADDAIPYMKVSEAAGQLDTRGDVLERAINAHPEWQVGPIRRRRYGDHWAHVIPRAHYSILRTKIPPKAEPGWYTVAVLRKRTRWSTDKIFAITEQIKCRMFRSPTVLLEWAPHYREVDVVSKLGVRKRYPPAAGWLTARVIRDRLGVDHKWLMDNIDLSIMEMREDARGNPRQHWPPTEVDRLRAVRAANPPKIGRPPQKKA